MRYFAEIDKNNRVLRVMVVKSGRYAKRLMGGYRWVETFPKDKDKNYCGKGWIYNDKKKNFYFERGDVTGFTLDEETLRWIPNKVHKAGEMISGDMNPDIMITHDRKIYRWNNNNLIWEIID